jgi:hypothetical protein
MEKISKWGTSLSNIVNVIKSRRMRWVEDVAYIGGNEKCKQRVLAQKKICKGRHCLSDKGGEGRKILKQIYKEIGCEGVDWIKLAQDRLQWQALVNMVMKLQVL